MADQRTDEMTPSAIEREIAQALAVEPSPEFLARVRMRIANEPPPRRMWPTWMPVLVGATAIAAAVTIAIVAPWRGVQVRLKPDTTTSTEATDKTLPVADVASSFSRTKTSQGETQARLKPDPTEKIVASEPQVLIAQDEAEALRRLFAQSAERGIEFTSNVMAAVNTAETDLLPPEIAILPIKIDPLIPPVNGEEGERQ